MSKARRRPGSRWQLWTAGASAALLVLVGGCSPAPTGELEPTQVGGRIEPVRLESVEVLDSFWKPRLDVNRRVTIPHILRENERTGRVDNFRKAAGLLPGPYVGRRFNDTDIYKVIEAASYTLIDSYDAELDGRLDELIALVVAAQEEDGYLFPARTIDSEEPAPGVGRDRWIHVSVGSHELYNAGHLIEAAVAHHRATDKRTLLAAAIRFADRIDEDFGPDARRDIPGHEEIELALVKLAELTGESRYLDLARFFLEQRGGTHDGELYPEDSDFAIYNDRLYKQDHLPVAQQAAGVGHAVRAAYLYAGMADVEARIEAADYAATLEAIWKDVVGSKLYLTGGIGSRDTVESFGESFELPNRTAYTETCAAIGNGLWSHRMFLGSGDARYLDVMERILYNGALSGVSSDGTSFFYTNPLESAGDSARSGYFDVACCPANLARLIAQLPELIYAVSEGQLFVNLYVASRAAIEVPGREHLTVQQETEYPWEGRVRLRLTMGRPEELTIFLRIPGWSSGRPVPSDLYRLAEPRGAGTSIRINGRSTTPAPAQGFVVLTRTWRDGDEIALDLPMEVGRVHAHPKLVENRGRVALQRGPVVFAAEAVDNQGSVLDLVLPEDAVVRSEFRTDLLGGLTVLRSTALRDGRQVPFTAIPYFAWANRGEGEMAVWLREEPAP